MPPSLHKNRDPSIPRYKTHQTSALLARATTWASWRQGQDSPCSLAVGLAVFVSSRAAFSARRADWRAPDRRPSPESKRPQDRENGLPRLPCNWSPMQRLTNDERNTRKKKPRGRRKPANPTNPPSTTARTNGTQVEKKRKAKAMQWNRERGRERERWDWPVLLWNQTTTRRSILFHGIRRGTHANPPRDNLPSTLTLKATRTSREPSLPSTNREW